MKKSSNKIRDFLQTKQAYFEQWRNIYVFVYVTMVILYSRTFHNLNSVYDAKYLKRGSIISNFENDTFYNINIEHAKRQHCILQSRITIYNRAIKYKRPKAQFIIHYKI